MKNKVTISGNPMRPAVTVNGVPLRGLRGVILDLGLHKAPTLTVELVVDEIEIDGQAQVIISDRSRDTLIKFGWTPPAEEDRA